MGSLMPSPQYICIYFGPNPDPKPGYWTQVSLGHHTARSAARVGLDALCIGGCTGYVVIYITKDSWKVMEESGTENLDITLQGNTFSVTRTPKLRFVAWDPVATCNSGY